MSRHPTLPPTDTRQYAGQERRGFRHFDAFSAEGYRGRAQVRMCA